MDYRDNYPDNEHNDFEADEEIHYDFETEETYYAEWRVKEEPKDWEKEAKIKIRISHDAPVPEGEENQRRRTIFDLGSFASSGYSPEQLLSITEGEEKPPEREVRYSIFLGAEGVARLNLSPLTQKIVGCVIDEDVTTEYPWIYVRKDIIEDNMDLHSESSDFLPVKDAIEKYPEPKILIGYAPSTVFEGQFYVCLNPAGKEVMERHIQETRKENESRVRKAIYKPIGEWTNLGSSEEMEAFQVVKNRELLEIPVIAKPIKLENLELSNQDAIVKEEEEVEKDTEKKTQEVSKDEKPQFLSEYRRFRGYHEDDEEEHIEIGPFEYDDLLALIYRKLLNTATQVSPETRANEVQTRFVYFTDQEEQYFFSDVPMKIKSMPAEKILALKICMKSYTDDVCDQALINSKWDIYKNDYRDLVLTEKDTQKPVIPAYAQRQSFHDGSIIVDKDINDLCWHPLWTGIAIAAYTQHAKADQISGPKFHDEVTCARKDNNIVLVWSFTDPLSPKLILECPREVTAVTVAPLDGNIVIGGCCNGQIVIWDITGKIEEVESIVVRTTAQSQYKGIMESLSNWMQKTPPSSIIRPAAMSSLRNSQKRAITQIVWLPSNYQLNKSGKLECLPENFEFHQLYQQFATSSEEGTIAFWDLNWRPPPKKDFHDRLKGKRGKIKKPAALTESISPFKALNGLFGPHYLLTVNYPSEDRRAIITTLSLYRPEFEKVQVEPFVKSEKDITTRRYYKPIIEDLSYTMEPKMLVGTLDGDFGCITWQGFEFLTGVALNIEPCSWDWMKSIHNGPVTHVVRSKFINELVATVGGSIFSVWKDNNKEPVIWKKSKIRYTAVAWGSYRPTVLILAQINGSIEIWDFVVKSHEPTFSQSLSGRIITGIYTHELPLVPQCLGFCMSTGILRTFTAPAVMQIYDKADIDWMRKFIDRQTEEV